MLATFVESRSFLVPPCRTSPRGEVVLAENAAVLESLRESWGIFRQNVAENSKRIAPALPKLRAGMRRGQNMLAYPVPVSLPRSLYVHTCVGPGGRTPTLV